ncbi:MAG: LysE family translocator [Desulfobacterales bacterium]|nr:LysE family translocator [Desulfobacterales bacterium]MCP4159633.1 LysE family translocator [Deltaproteobacteria bacterium]
MDLITTLSLALAMFILAITPGPGVLATVAKSLATGFQNSLGLILGIVLGDAIFLLFAIFGLSFVAKVMGDFFIIVKYCGSLYLIWIGIKIFITKETNISETSKTGNFITGLLITLSNPKVILFYCGFLPTFLDLSNLKNTDIMIVFFVILSILASVLMAYAYLGESTRSLIKNKKSLRRVNKIAGCVMVTSGIAIVTKS